MSKEDDIRDAINQAVRMLTEASGNPRTWQSWMVHLLGQLEDEAAKGSPGYRESFTDMLSALQDAIRNRIRTGGWN